LKDDVHAVSEFNGLNDTILARKETLKNVNEYVSGQISVIVNILQNRSFINYVDSCHIITPKGILSTHIQEIPGHIFSELIIKHDYFRDLDTKYIAAIFSCFTNVTTNEQARNTNVACSHVINDLRSITDEYYDLENTNKIDISENYEFHTHIVNETIEWCDATDEQTCRNIIATLYENKNIFLGDFIKAILKINNIAAELLKLNDLSVSLQHKLAEIKTLTQKYVVTNQSLYI